MKLFPNLCATTVYKGMRRGKKHQQNIRENSNTNFLTVPVPDPVNPDGDKFKRNKILLQIPVCELHNNMLSDDCMIGFPG